MAFQLVENTMMLNMVFECYHRKKTITNYYILQNQSDDLIKKKKMFLIKGVDNAFILISKLGFYRLYYFLNDLNEYPVSIPNETVVIEILYRKNGYQPSELIKYWEVVGFKKHLIREHMFALYNQIRFFEEDDSVHVKFAKEPDEVIFAKTLIEETFDRYTGDIISLEEADLLARNNNILVSYIDGNLTGVIKFENNNGIILWGHFAIKPEYRGKKVATKLMQSFFRLNGTSPITKYQMWVVVDNEKARGIYQKIGFIFDTKVSQSMLKI